MSEEGDVYQRQGRAVLMTDIVLHVFPREKDKQSLEEAVGRVRARGSQVESAIEWASLFID